MSAAPRELLARFHSNRAGFDEVMRGLMNHADWLAPVRLAQEALGGEGVVLPQLLRYGEATRLPPGEAWLFTDGEAAQAALAGGAELGPYAGRLVGCTLFEALECEMTGVKVNPGSDPAHALSIPQDTIRIAKSWARAVAVERELERAPSPTHPPLLARLRRYLGYEILLHPNHAIVTAAGFGGFDRPAVVFTAPDCAERCLAAMPLELARRLLRIPVVGEDLFAQMVGQDVDGLVFNPVGPARPCVLPVSVCASVLAAEAE